MTKKKIKPKEKTEIETLTEVVSVLVENQNKMAESTSEHIQKLTDQVNELDKMIPRHRDPTARDLEVNQIAVASDKMNQTLKEKGLLETKLIDVRVGEIAEIIRATAEYKAVTQPHVMSETDKMFIQTGSDAYRSYLETIAHITSKEKAIQGIRQTETKISRIGVQ